LTPVSVALFLAVVFIVAGIDGQAQSARRRGPRDWSSNRLIASRFGPDHGANIARNWRTAMKDAQLDRAGASSSDSPRDLIADLRDRFRPKPQPGHLDWNFSTGGFGPVVGSPAKYSNVNITTNSCSDVVYFTVDQPGTATAVNVIAVTNVYSSLCGATPTVKFAFALPNGVPTSAVPSLNGEQLYVLESRAAGVVLHAINVNLVGANATYNGTNWASGRDLSTVGMGTTGEQLFEITFPGVVDTLASPFLDYDGTQIFFGDSGGKIYRVQNVHLATASVDATNFPVQCGTAALQSPVFVVPAAAPANPQIVTASADGRVYRINTSVPPPGGVYTCIASSQGGAGLAGGVGGGISAPVIDVTNEQIIIVGNNANGFPLRGIGVIPLRFAAGTGQTSSQSLGLSSTTIAPQPPSFDELFWSTGTGNIYVPGAPSAGVGAGTYLIKVPYNGLAVGTPSGFATLTRTGAAQTFATSPVTEFLTASALANKDFVFIGGASGNGTGNYRYINRIGAGFLGSDAVPVAMSGSFQYHATSGGVSSGIVVDTRTAGVTGGTATANVYFGTVGDAANSLTSRIIQLAQQF
jgi:hypothetical protein